MSRASRLLAAGGTVLTAAVALTACSPGPSGSGEDRALTIGVPTWQLGAAWDPAAGSAGLWFIGNHPVYEPLIKWDVENAEFVGGLAESFELDDDGKTLSLTLREDVDFVDGEHLDADAVVTALADAFTRKESAWKSWEGLVSAVATGEYTVDILFQDAQYDVYSHKLYNLVHIPIASPAALADPAVFDEGPVGTGPYILDESIADVSVSFIRNPDYRDPDAYPWDTITVKAFDDRVAALNAIKSGQLDAAEMDSSFVAEAEAVGLRVQTASSGFATIGFVVASDASSPEARARLAEVQDVRVRQAISMAFDREAIRDQIDRGYGSASSQPFDPATAEYVEGGDDYYPYDPEKARELLAEAGYPDGFTLRLPLLSRTENEVGRYKAIVEQSLADIGITVEYIQLEDATADAEMRNGRVHASFWQGFYPNVDRDAVAWILANENQVDEEIFRAAEHYTSGSLAEHAAAQKVISEYVLEKATDVVIAHPLQFWVSSPDVVVTPSNLPDYFIKLDNFSLAE